LAEDAAPPYDAAATLHTLARALFFDLGDSAFELGQKCLLLREVVGKPKREVDFLTSPNTTCSSVS